jgi:hypothetical protein
MERVKKLGILRGTKQDPGNAEARVQYQIRAQQVNKMMAVFSSSKKSTMQKKFPVISNLRYMHGVLNVDEIKN